MGEHAPYAWKISFDHLDHVKDDTAGPRNIDPALEAKLDAAIKGGRKNAADFPEVEWFRMYDDDGELYYTGVRTGESDDSGYGSEHGFEPLDDYGTPNAGCTEIRYLNLAKSTADKEEWETL